MINTETRTWDPRDPDVLKDQRAAYDEMRERCPVAHSDFLGWSLFSHDAVVDVVKDPETFSSATKRTAVPNGMDPPAHTEYRGALAPYFTPERMAGFEPHSRRIASELLGSALERDDLEAIGDYVDPFAHQAVCAFMGWPVEDWNRIHGWTHGNQEAAFSRDREAGARLAREFSTYVTELIEARRSDGSTTDLMGELTQTTVDGRALSDEEIVSALRTWTAGHGTVAAALGIVIRHLADHTELQDRLRNDRELIDVAIAEILRTDGPLVSNNRTTAREVEIDGQTIPAGERISVIWIAANRDPDTYADAERVDLERDAEDNLLFGAGIHRCLGEPLARLNLRVGVEELLDHSDRFDLAASVELRRHHYPSNGLVELPLRMRAPTASR